MLGRVELVPDRIERAQGFNRVVLVEDCVFGRAILPAHRGDGPRDELGRCQQPPDLPQHEALDLAGGDRAYWAGVVAAPAGA